jgi:hypothetical protein
MDLHRRYSTAMPARNSTAGFGSQTRKYRPTFDKDLSLQQEVFRPDGNPSPGEGFLCRSPAYTFPSTNNRPGSKVHPAALHSWIRFATSFLLFPFPSGRKTASSVPTTSLFGCLEWGRGILICVPFGAKLDACLLDREYMGRCRSVWM